jgi:hypothetical protein
MAECRLIGLIRVSTERQGQSGLGLEAQQVAIDEYQRRTGCSCSKCTARSRAASMTTSMIGRYCAGELAAARVAEEKAARASERAILGAMRARWQTVDAVLGALDAGCSLLMAAELTAAGFYRHDRGAWRRRGGLREA